MKYSFNFIQVANWLYVCRQNFKKIQQHLIKKDIADDQMLNLLTKEKKHLNILKSILNRKTRLYGIGPDFIKNMKNIKKEYGIEE